MDATPQRLGREFCAAAVGLTALGGDTRTVTSMLLPVLNRGTVKSHHQITTQLQRVTKTHQLERDTAQPSNQHHASQRPQIELDITSPQAKPTPLRPQPFLASSHSLRRIDMGKRIGMV